MNNPFEALRKKREAEALRKEQEQQAKRQAGQVRMAENQRLFSQYAERYSFVVRVLDQLREAIYKPDVKLHGPKPIKDTRYQYGRDASDPDLWRPVWELMHWTEEPISDTGPMTEKWNTDVKVTLDFDKRKNPIFVCETNDLIKPTCPATEADLIKTLTKLHA